MLVEYRKNIIKWEKGITRITRNICSKKIKKNIRIFWKIDSETITLLQEANLNKNLL